MSTRVSIVIAILSLSQLAFAAHAFGQHRHQQIEFGQLRIVRIAAVNEALIEFFGELIIVLRGIVAQVFGFDHSDRKQGHG